MSGGHSAAPAEIGAQNEGVNPIKPIKKVTRHGVVKAR